MTMSSAASKKRVKNKKIENSVLSPLYPCVQRVKFSLCIVNLPFFIIM